jgi:hypothetical protein
MIDRVVDNAVFASLSEANLGPGCYGTFKNGRVEQFLDVSPTASGPLVFCDSFSLLLGWRVALVLTTSFSSTPSTATPRHLTMYCNDPQDCRTLKPADLSNREIAQGIAAELARVHGWTPPSEAVGAGREPGLFKQLWAWHAQAIKVSFDAESVRNVFKSHSEEFWGGHGPGEPTKQLP